MTTDSTYKEVWKEICNTKMAKDVSDIFLDKIESSKLLYEQSFQLQDPLKPPFDVNSYKKYYPCARR